MYHLTKRDLAGFLSGTLKPVAWRRVVRHLLSACRPCKQRLLQAAPLIFLEELPDGAAIPADAYDGPIDRALDSMKRHEARWRREREKLARLLEVVEASGREGIDARRARAGRGWPLVEVLLRLSHEARYRNQEAMLWLAFEARVAAESIEPGEYEPGFVFDLRARAWAELGNAHRVNEEHDLSEAAFRQARALLSQGTGDLLLHARVADLEASLRKEQRRLPEALSLLDDVHRLYLEIGDRHLAGRALISRGISLHTGGTPAEGAQSLRNGLALIEPDRDRSLASVGRQALLHAMVDCGDFREAASYLLQSGLRQAFADDPLNLLRLRGVEGKIFAGLGKLERAEGIFLDVRREFRERDLEYDAALVGLELAAVWLRQGQAERVRGLAKDMLATFRALGIQAEAVKALRFLDEACRLRVTNVRIVDGVRSFLVRLQGEPWLRFDPESVG
jgi:tetratricopeptide (TPR) repeat protein